MFNQMLIKIRFPVKFPFFSRDPLDRWVTLYYENDHVNKPTKIIVCVQVFVQYK